MKKYNFPLIRKKQCNKANNSNLVTIEAKAITTAADANEVILRNRAAMTEYVRTELQKLGEPWPVCDLRTGLFTIGKDDNPYDYIINTANYMSCANGDSWYLFFENIRLKREIAALKKNRIIIDTGRKIIK